MKSPIENIIADEGPRYRTASAYVVDTLRQGILSGVLAEGTPLRQDQLAEKFSLSRMPIREALRQLEAEGLIHHEPHKGAVVAIMAADDIIEIFEMRAMAECLALRKAFSGIKEKTMVEISATLDEMDATKDPDQLSELNQRFHSLLYCSAKRPRLQALIKSLHDSVDRYLRFLLTNLDYHDQSQKEHRAILYACQEGDCEKAVEALEDHLLGGRDAVVAFLARRDLARQPY